MGAGVGRRYPLLDEEISLGRLGNELKVRQNVETPTVSTPVSRKFMSEMHKLSQIHRTTSNPHLERSLEI
jgi:hypothetical protein